MTLKDRAISPPGSWVLCSKTQYPRHSWSSKLVVDESQRLLNHLVVIPKADRPMGLSPNMLVRMEPQYGLLLLLVKEL